MGLYSHHNKEYKWAILVPLTRIQRVFLFVFFWARETYLIIIIISFPPLLLASSFVLRRGHRPMRQLRFQISWLFSSQALPKRKEGELSKEVRICVYIKEGVFREKRLQLLLPLPIHDATTQ